jgi:hypothetical protein
LEERHIYKCQLLPTISGNEVRCRRIRVYRGTLGQACKRGSGWLFSPIFFFSAFPLLFLCFFSAFSLQSFKSIYLPVINRIVAINIEKSPKTANQIK